MNSLAADRMSSGEPCVEARAGTGNAPVLDQVLQCRVNAGGPSRPVQVHYRLEGRFGPVVLVLGGINSGRDIKAWWPHQYGPGGALDPGRLRLLSLDWPGTVDGDCGPLLTHDHAQAIEAVLAELGIRRLYAVVGASFGAMVALALAERGQAAVDRLLVISGAHYSHPAATAVRHLQREIVYLGEIAGLPATGLSIARGLAMTSYRTPALLSRRFDQADAGQRLASLESYLAHVGRQFAVRFEPGDFLRLSESLDLHQVDPSCIHCPVTVVGVDSDRLVPISQMRELADGLAGPVRFMKLPSDCGHDAFLLEHARIRHILIDCLEGEEHVSA